MKRDGLDCDALERELENGELRLFLYAKGLLAGESRVVRVEKFHDLLYPQEADVSDEEKAMQAGN
jgi:hypothetical protein